MQTILIVEDDTLQLHALQNSIQQAYPDWTIHTATDIDTVFQNTYFIFNFISK